MVVLPIPQFIQTGEEKMVDVNFDFESLSLEELTHIQKEVSRIVDRRVATELHQYRLQVQKLAQSIGLSVSDTEGKGKTEKTEKVGTEKYRHPVNPSLVWEGTGRKPKWVNELLKSGYSLDALRVPQQETVEPKPEPAQAQEEEQKGKSEWPL
jgi:DNA-binding protein H-NS